MNFKLMKIRAKHETTISGTTWRLRPENSKDTSLAAHKLGDAVLEGWLLD